MDDADRAQETELRLLEASIRAARGVPARSPRLPEGGQPPADCCEMCGLLIPSARQIAVPGTRHCVECAEELERRARQARMGMGWGLS